MITKNTRKPLRFYVLLIFILFIYPLSVSGFSSAQLSDIESVLNVRRHSLGFQINPYLGKSTSFNPAMNRYLLMGTMRYGFQANLKTTLGAELSATHLQMGDNQHYRTVGLGTFGRFWFWQKSWIRTGIEGNVFVTRRFYSLNSWNPDNHSYLEDLWKQKYYFMYFISPVISLSKKQSRWSFDLMYKFTHRQKMNYGDKSVFSYRINFHF